MATKRKSFLWDDPSIYPQRCIRCGVRVVVDEILVDYDEKWFLSFIFGPRKKSISKLHLCCGCGWLFDNEVIDRGDKKAHKKRIEDVIYNYCASPRF